MANEKVAHQGTVVEVASNGPGEDAVIQDGQGLVFRTEGNRFGTLGADGFYHGYVPSTQVRDILMGQGESVEDEPQTAMDLAIEKAKDQDAPMVAGSEAPFPTGDAENVTDSSAEPNVVINTDRDETLTPMSNAETSAANSTQASAAPKSSKATDKG